MKIKKIGVGIVGLGTVGTGLIEIIQKNKNLYKNKYNIDFSLMVSLQKIRKKEKYKY